MPKVRAGADKWQKRAAAAAPEYASGVASPRVPWEEATRASAAAYTDGVQQALQEGRFERGITGQAAAKYRQKATTLGVQRYGTGVQASKDAYQQGFEPYRQVIESIQLPPRGRRGDPANMQRSAAIASALHEKRKSM